MALALVFEKHHKVYLHDWSHVDPDQQIILNEFTELYSTSDRVTDIFIISEFCTLQLFPREEKDNVRVLVGNES